jgi:tetratricopeptide (TPR) repeat protein
MTTDEGQRTKDETQIAVFDARSAIVRVALIAAIIFALVFGWFSIRWQLGNMIASLTLPTAPNAKEVARLATGLSPSDPTTNWFAASVEGSNFSPESSQNALRGFQQAVRLAPFDFWWWNQLGRAYENAGDLQRAEAALVYATKLAPNYTLPHWQLGNFYVRHGRETEAFDELRKVAENNVVYREQVFSIVWDYYEKDAAKLEQIAGNSPSVRASLAKFYAAKESAENSLRVWNTLSPEEKEKHQDVAKLIAQALYDKRFYRSAVQFVRQIGVEYNAQIEEVENAGFESLIRDEETPVFFGWRVLRIDKIEVKTDPYEKHEGSRSLSVSFKGFAGIELNNLYQIVAVNSNQRYRLSFWLKTENLKSPGTPTLEIINSNDDKLIASSKPFPAGTNDWQHIQIEFATPANAEAVTLRTGRSYCGNGCPILGTLWLDDFKLEKIK